MPFQVCLFDDGIQAMPLAWINGDHCRYPPYINQLRINKSISMEEEPQDDWATHRVLRKFGNPTENYTDAVNKAKIAEEFSDVDTDDVDTNKIKRRERAAKRLDFEDDDPDDPKSLLWAMPKKHSKKNKPHQVKSIPPLPTPPPRRSPRKTPPSLKYSPSLNTPSPLPGLSCDNPNELNIAGTSSQKDTLPITTPSSQKKSTGKSTGKDFNTELLKKVNLILYKIKQIEMKVDRLSEGGKQTITTEEDEINNKFPLTNLAEVEEFERQCSIDPQLVQNCVAMLRSLGGSNILDTTVRVLKRTLSDNVAELYSLVGRKKRSFRALSLYKAVLNSVKIQMRDATVKEIDLVIARWLVQAKTRRIRKSSKALAGALAVADENSNESVVANEVVAG